MPVEFLSDEQAAAYGLLPESLSRAELERFFFLDDVDPGLVEAKRRDHNRLRFALQQVTVRNAGGVPRRSAGRVGGVGRLPR